MPRSHSDPLLSDAAPEAVVEVPAKSRALIAALLFALALLLRLFGIGWGLPDDLHHQSFHPDEYLIWTQAQRIEPAKGQFVPGFYNYGTLYLTLLRISGDVTAAYTGGPKDGDPDSKWAFIGRSTLSGRILSALAGSGTAVVVFFLLLKFTNRWGAVFGALLPAIAPAFVIHSRFQTVDVLATFFLAVSALYAIRIVYPRAVFGDPGSDDDPPILDHQPSIIKAPWRDAIICGLFAGLSAGTKYTGILALLSLYMSLGLMRPLLPSPPVGGAGRGLSPTWQTRFKLALAGTATALLTLVITTPGIVLDSEAFFRDFGYEMAHTSSGHGLLFEGTGSGFLYQLVNLQVGLGVLLFLVSFAGLLYGLMRGPWQTYFAAYGSGTGTAFKRWLHAKIEALKAFGKEQPWALVLIAFWIPYYLLIGRAEVKFLRYTFPLYIGLAAGLGFAVAEARKRGGWGHGVVAVAILALGGFDPGGLRKTLTLSIQMQARDAREQAVDALREMQKQKPDLTVGFANDPWYYSPPTFPDTGLFRAAPFLEKMYGEMLQVAQPKSLWYMPPEVLSDNQWDQQKIAARPRWDSRLIAELKPDYIALSNFETYDVERLKGRADISESARSEVSQAWQFLDLLREKYQPVRQFGQLGDTVNDMMYTQPSVVLWKRKNLP